MKRHLIVGLSLGVTLCIVSPLVVHAVNEPAPRPGSVQTVPSDSASELNARIENRKIKQQTRLNNTEAARIGSRCVGAQQKLVGINKKFSDNNNPLRVQYEAYSARLEKVAQKADAQNIDTTEFKKSASAFSQQYQVMVAAINEFDVSVSDLKSIDCKTNPTAFKATLDAARLALTDIQTARAELIKIAKGPVQDSIKALKASIEKKKN